MQYDKDFLIDLNSQKNKNIYAKITLFTFNEEPIDSIEGRVTSGSLSIDGNSNMRRTCSLSLSLTEEEVKEYYWALNAKFKLEIGLKNYIDSSKPDIIWFNEGIYVITSFSMQKSLRGNNVNISGKDKMCLLNGDIGGNLTATTDFGKIEIRDEAGNSTVYKYPIKDIIRDSVHSFAGEPFSNIIVNDLDDYGLELLEYAYPTKDLYLFKPINDNTYSEGAIDGQTSETCVKECIFKGTLIKICDLENTTVDGVTGKYDINGQGGTAVEIDGSNYTIARLTKGDTAGYRLVDLVYPGELVANVGEAFTQTLDKIKNMLGDFEYFYDVEGHFVFQRKKIYINTKWSPIVKNEDEESYVENIEIAKSKFYHFDNEELIVSNSISPKLETVRNDYSVWGNRKSVTGQSLPIHMRYAIDEKPFAYTSLTVTEEDLVDYNKAYNLEVKPQIGRRYTSDLVDWREIIYQMARDYAKFNHFDDFELRVAEANQIDELYPTGSTGYEQYYIDLLKFWRNLYNPDYIPVEQSKGILGKDILGDFYLGGILFSPEEAAALQSENEEFYPRGDVHQFWAKRVYESPETLDFWLDFLDGNIELSKYSNKIIGNRPKVVNDTDINAIYFRDVPDIIFISSEDEKRTDKPGYHYFQTSDTDSLFTISSKYKSAKNVIDGLLYNYSCCAESVNISMISCYYLDVNQKISILGKPYLVQKISIPLTGGTMTVAANKSIE